MLLQKSQLSFQWFDTNTFLEETCTYSELIHFWGQNTTSMSATENVLIGKFLMTWMFEMTTYLSLAAWKGRKQFGLLFFNTCLRELKGNRKSGVKHTLEIMVLFANMTKKKKLKHKSSNTITFGQSNRGITNEMARTIILNLLRRVQCCARV